MTLRLAGELRGHVGAVNGVTFAPDGRLLASTGDEGRVCLWDVPSRTLVGALDCPAWNPTFLARGAVLAVAVDDTVRILSRRGAEVAALPGHVPRATSIAPTPDGTLLLTGDRGGLVHVWEVGTWRELHAAPAIREDGPPEPPDPDDGPDARGVFFSACAGDGRLAVDCPRTRGTLHVLALHAPTGSRARRTCRAAGRCTSRPARSSPRSSRRMVGTWQPRPETSSLYGYMTETR